MQLPVLPQGDIDVSTTSSQPPAPQRCFLESITGALSDTQLAVASMHKRVEDLERNLHSRTQELNAVKAEFAEFKTSVEKQLADIHSVMTGRVPADAPGQHSGLPCEPRMCRLPAYVDGLRSGPSYVFARLESIINPSSCPDYSNYGLQNPAASGWSELSHKEHARQTAQETKERLSRMMPDYIQRKDALTNQQKERSAQMQMRVEEEKEERREAFWKKRADEQLREAIHAERIKKWEQRKEDKTSALRKRVFDKEDKMRNESRKKQRQGRDLVEGALKEYRDEIEEVRRKAEQLQRFREKIRKRKEATCKKKQAERLRRQAELEIILKEEEAQRIQREENAQRVCRERKAERMRNAKEMWERPPQTRKAGIVRIETDSTTVHGSGSHSSLSPIHLHPVSFSPVENIGKVQGYAFEREVLEAALWRARVAETVAHRAPRRIESNKGGPSIATNALRRSVAELSTDAIALPTEINGRTDLSEVDINQANVGQQHRHAVSSNMTAVPAVPETGSIPRPGRYRPGTFCKSREVGRTREAHAVRVETLNHASPLALPSRASEGHDSCGPESIVSQKRVWRPRRL